MIAVIATIHATEGKEKEYETVMSELVDAVNANEEGCKLYTLTKDQDGTYRVMELYDDRDALAAHGQSEHMKRIGAKMAGLTTGRPEIIVMDVVRGA